MSLPRALKIRPGEGRIALRLLLLTVALWTGTAIGANAVESLFFVRFGPEFLPYLYIAVGAVTFGVMTALNAVMARSGGSSFTVMAPVAMALAVVGLRGMVFVSSRWVYPVMWVAMMIVWTLELFAVWTLAGRVHDTRQAKRLFPLYGSGLIVGGVVGGLLTGPLASWLGTENLLVIWAGVLVLASLLSRSILKGSALPPPARRLARSSAPGLLAPLAEGFRVVRRSRLLRVMAVCLVLFALLYFSLALLFARAATARFPEADRLAGFLGLFMGVSSAAALVLSLTVANRLFARFGVAAGVLVLPAVYLVGFGVLVIQPAFIALVLFRFIQMAWVNGVWATGWQALFNVVLPEARDRVRTFMDAVPLQLGMIASGVLLLLAERVLEPHQVALVGLVAAAVATVAMWRGRRAYTEALVEALRAGNPEVFVEEEEPFGGFRSDAAAMEIAMGGASDPDVTVRRIATEVLADSVPTEALPVLTRNLHDEDPVVRRAALRGLARVGDGAPVAEIAQLLGDGDEDVRSLAVEAVAGSSDASEAASLLQPLLEDGNARTRARAGAALLKSEASAEAAGVLDSMAASPRPDWRAEAVSALGETGGRPDLVSRALGDPNPAVRRAAVRAARRLDPADALDALIPMLGDEDEAVREAAVEAVAGVGTPAIDRLVEAVEDPRLEAGVVLALASLPSADPGLLRRYAATQVDRAVEDAGLIQALSDEDGEGVEVLRHALRHRSSERAVAALRAVTGLADPAAMRLAIENLASRDPVQRANAFETLEAVGDRALVRPLLRVWEGDAETPVPSVGAVARLLRDPDPWVRACAVYAAAASRETPIREEVDRLARSDADTLVRETAQRALEGATSVRALSSLSLMERVVFLRRVPLFAELSPADLKHVAEVASEHAYPAGAAVAEQGEPGDELYILVEGEISVAVAGDGRGETEVARRGVGDYVGEMSLITGEPRMATLRCVGDVRALAIDRKRFERILRERPDASLAMMRVLSNRLRESHGLGASA
jgi:HEAT repeat protein